VLRWLLEFARQFLRNRYFPDKAVDLLFQCLGYAVANGKQSVSLADAKIVAERMVGMPLELATRQEALSETLTERCLMAPNDVQVLLHRLTVTLRGLDIRPARPNAVMLLIDEMARRGLALAEAIAESLFGNPERVVTIDCGRFTESHDITLLLGSPPGYIGYGGSLELHKVAQSPWCVLRCENLHSCHPYVREVLEQGIAEGFLTDSTGKKIYLSDAVVLLTAELAAHKTHKIGFQQGGEESNTNARGVAEQAFSPRLVGLCDVVCAQAPRIEDTGRDWLERHILREWSERYVAKGLEVRWDEALVNWLLAQHDVSAGKQDWEHLIDDRLSALLVPYVDEAVTGQVKVLCVTCQGEPAVVETPEPEKGE
jgi:ATP-dependent Clp protease ATP-binding subunit ClpC